jgi:prepilin-type processing-associated H-X9-DG protein
MICRLENIISALNSKPTWFFCDGHVEAPTLEFLFEEINNTASSRWNRDHLPHREKLFP